MLGGRNGALIEEKRASAGVKPNQPTRVRIQGNESEWGTVNLPWSGPGERVEAPLPTRFHLKRLPRRWVTGTQVVYIKHCEKGETEQPLVKLGVVAVNPTTRRRKTKTTGSGRKEGNGSLLREHRPSPQKGRAARQKQNLSFCFQTIKIVKLPDTRGGTRRKGELEWEGLRVHSKTATCPSPKRRAKSHRRRRLQGRKGLPLH